MGWTRIFLIGMTCFFCWGCIIIDDFGGVWYTSINNVESTYAFASVSARGIFYVVSFASLRHYMCFVVFYSISNFIFSTIEFISSSVAFSI